MENYNSRQWEILIRLADTLDNYQVTNEKYVKQIGNVTFRFASNVISGKLANNSSMGILSVPIHVKSMGLHSTKF